MEPIEELSLVDLEVPGGVLLGSRRIPPPAGAPLHSNQTLKFVTVVFEISLTLNSLDLIPGK